MRILLIERMMAKVGPMAIRSILGHTDSKTTGVYMTAVNNGLRE